MKKVISGACAFGTMFVNALRSKRKRAGDQFIQNDKILIIRGGHLGDAVVDAESLKTLTKFYSERGKRLYLICSPSIWELLGRIFDTKDIVYLGECYMHSDCLVSERVQIISDLADGIDFECIITLSEGSRAHCTVTHLHANEKWGVFGNSHTTCLKRIIGFLSRRCYTKIVLFPDDIRLIKIMETLLHELGIPDYQAKITQFPRRTEVVLPTRPYITISIDSANTARRWTKEQFIRLIRMLQERFDHDIYLIGERKSEELAEGIKRFFGDHVDRVKNIVGKTNLEEWIEWIRGSVFLIGVDSGSIHIATAVGTQSFCLTGEWENHRAISYEQKDMSKESVLPVCISRTDAAEIHCAGCVLYGGRHGYGNRKCAVACKKGQPCLCLQKISAEDVMKVINHTLAVQGEQLQSL